MAHKEEIERKFLVHAERLPELPPGVRMAQAYLGFQPTVRVRTQAGPGEKREAFLTIKGEGLVGRDEFEYAIPYEEAEALLRLSAFAPVEKTRHYLPIGGGGLTWEIDLFAGANAGLIVAEIELPSAEHPVELPPWIGREVTRDPAYKNAALARRPFTAWAGGAVSAAE